MEWLKTYYVEIFAIFGGLYTIARIVVAATPTPKDNEALAEVGKILRIIAKIVGLDLTQGITKPKKKPY